MSKVNDTIDDPFVCYFEYGDTDTLTPEECEAADEWLAEWKAAHPRSDFIGFTYAETTDFGECSILRMGAQARDVTLHFKRKTKKGTT